MISSLCMEKNIKFKENKVIEFLWLVSSSKYIAWSGAKITFEFCMIQ